MATVLIRNLVKEVRPQALFSGDPLEITNSFQSMSEVINVKGADSIFLWVKTTAGTSTDIQINVLGGLEPDDLSYRFPIETVSSSKIDLTPEVRELPDANNSYMFEVVLNRGIPYLKFQIKDAADGSGQLTSAYITFKY